MVTKGIILIGLALIISLLGLFLSTQSVFTLDRAIIDAKEAARPADIKIVKITASGCKECFDAEKAVAEFKKQNIKVLEEKTLNLDSPEAGAAISKLEIKKVPTFIATGEINKDNLSFYVKSKGEIKDGTFIFTKLIPLYLNPETSEEEGWVTASLILDPSCPKCANLRPSIENFKKSGVKIKEINEYAWNSFQGQTLISKYNLTKIPAFIFSPEFDLYTNVKNTWNNFGTIEEDKSYVARNVPFAYRDLEKGQILGLVDIIYLTDSSCPDCYKTEDMQKPILTRGYGVILNLERTVDSSSYEGRALIAKYGIEKIPTIILSPQAAEYSSLKNVWPNVGKVAEDGYYIFTNFAQLGKVVYKDLIQNSIIRP